MTKFRMLILSTAIVFVMSGLRGDEPRDAKNKLQGVWVAERVTSSGNTVPAEKFPFELHFERSQLVFKFTGPVAGGKDLIHEIVVDDTKDPATIDIAREIRGKKETVHGIYKLDDGRLWICSLRDANGQPSSDRPSNFESSPTVKSDLLILTPKPKDAK